MNEARLDTRREAAHDDDFSAFVRSRTPALLRAAYLLTGDQHHAEDLVQSALARTHLAWGRLRDTGNAEAYTRKIMYHLQVSAWRRRRPTESTLLDAAEPADPDDPAGRADLRLVIRAALARLTPKQRAVLVLRYFEDRSEAETADLLNVSLGTVKSQTSHALDRIRTLAPELAALADEARPTDLEPGVRRTSRRIARRRTTAAVIAAVVAVVAIATAASGLRRQTDAPPVVPTPTPSPSVTGPASLPPPAGTSAAFGCPGVSTQPRRGATLPGTLYFLTFAESCVSVSRLSGGQVRVVAAVPIGFPPSLTAALSPDASRLAWVTDRGEGQPGDLAVVTLGGSPRLIGGMVHNSSGPNPRWEADSRHLVVSTPNDGAYRVDTESGESVPADGAGPFVSYSPNGRYQASEGPDGTTVVVARADGTVEHTVTYAGPTFACECGFLVQGVSDDGRQVAVSYRNSDPGRPRAATAIVDSSTGREIPLPVAVPAGLRVAQVYLRPGGGLLIVTRTVDDTDPRVTVVSPTGAVTHDRVSVPELTGAIAAVQDPTHR